MRRARYKVPGPEGSVGCGARDKVPLRIRKTKERGRETELELERGLELEREIAPERED